MKIKLLLLFIVCHITNLYAIDFGDTIVLTNSTTYYSLTGEPKATCFTLNDSGYIIVGNNNQIYEFSLSQRPLLKYKHVIEKISKNNYKNIDTLYPEVGIYIACLYNEKNDTPVFIDLQNQQKAMIKSFNKTDTVVNIEVDTGIIISKLKELSKKKEVFIENVPNHPFFKNTHITAMGNLLNYWGYRNKSMPINTFMGNMLIYSSRCLCDNKYKPTVYEIGKGLKKFTKAQRNEIEVEEVIYNSKNAFNFYSYKHSIDNKVPALISFVYESDVFPNSNKWSKYRINSISVLGVGYLGSKFIKVRFNNNQDNRLQVLITYYNSLMLKNILALFARRDSIELRSEFKK